jgi:hypothetical protein
MAGSALRIDDELSLPELLAIIADLYHQLQALELGHLNTARARRTPEYLSLEATIRSYAQQVWALTAGSDQRR